MHIEEIASLVGEEPSPVRFVVAVLDRQVAEEVVCVVGVCFSCEALLAPSAVPFLVHGIESEGHAVLGPARGVR